MRRTDAGFTLLEVIVALAIAAASVASLYQIYTLGWRGVRLAAIDGAALEVAHSQLASAGVEAPLVEGETSGISPDGVAWTSTISAYAPPGDAAIAPLTLGTSTSAAVFQPSAFWVSVTVVWTPGPAQPSRSLILQTIKLARPQ